LDKISKEATTGCDENVFMNDEYIRIWEEVVVAYLKIASQ